MKNLERVQKVMKALKIISILFIVFYAINIIGSLVMTIIFSTASKYNTDPNSFESIIALTTFPQAIMSYVIVAITSLGGCILSILSLRFYNHELLIGTPFNLDVIKECKRLGIDYLVITFVVTVVIKIIISINDIQGVRLSFISGIIIGITYLIVTSILRYGNEILESKIK